MTPITFDFWEQGYISCVLVKPIPHLQNLRSHEWHWKIDKTDQTKCTPMTRNFNNLPIWGRQELMSWVYSGKKESKKKGGKGARIRYNQSKGFTLEYHVQEETRSLINSVLNSYNSPQIKEQMFQLMTVHEHLSNGSETIVSHDETNFVPTKSKIYLGQPKISKILGVRKELQK